MMRLMGIDYGDARIGIALSDLLQITAQGYTTLKNTQDESVFDEIQKIIKEKEVGKIILGLPKNMDNTEGFRAKATYEFAEKLKEYTDKEIVFWDERLSTVAAQTYMNTMDIRGKKRKGLVDTIAAALILENYMKTN
ncbi:MAG: Holliday junction resolvase RuvX [Ruminococcaceae bacterium]|nr:Holliday junction resolvase RuvX [Oscillospiraceae bacterium]